jgi:hypothetical protein
MNEKNRTAAGLALLFPFPQGEMDAWLVGQYFDKVAVTVGPVIGKVTATSAVVVIEVDAPAPGTVGVRHARYGRYGRWKGRGRCHATPRHATPCHATPRHATLFWAHIPANSSAHALAAW